MLSKTFLRQNNRQMLRKDEDMFEADTETTHNKKRMLDMLGAWWGMCGMWPSLP